MTQKDFVRQRLSRGDRPHWTQDPDQAGTFWRWCCEKKKLDPSTVLTILKVATLDKWTSPQICARATILLWLSPPATTST